MKKVYKGPFLNMLLSLKPFMKFMYPDLDHLIDCFTNIIKDFVSSNDFLNSEFLGKKMVIGDDITITKYVMFLDSDTILSKKAAENLISKFDDKTAGVGAEVRIQFNLLLSIFKIIVFNTNTFNELHKKRYSSLNSSKRISASTAAFLLSILSSFSSLHGF